MERQAIIDALNGTDSTARTAAREELEQRISALNINVTPPEFQNPERLLAKIEQAEQRAGQNNQQDDRGEPLPEGVQPKSITKTCLVTFENPSKEMTTAGGHKVVKIAIIEFFNEEMEHCSTARQLTSKQLVNEDSSDSTLGKLVKAGEPAVVKMTGEVRVGGQTGYRDPDGTIKRHLASGWSPNVVSATKTEAQKWEELVNGSTQVAINAGSKRASDRITVGTLKDVLEISKSVQEGSVQDRLLSSFMTGLGGRS